MNRLVKSSLARPYNVKACRMPYTRSLISARPFRLPDSSQPVEGSDTKRCALVTRKFRLSSLLPNGTPLYWHPVQFTAEPPKDEAALKQSLPESEREPTLQAIQQVNAAKYEQLAFSLLKLAADKTYGPEVRGMLSYWADNNLKVNWIPEHELGDALAYVQSTSKTGPMLFLDRTQFVDSPATPDEQLGILRNEHFHLKAIQEEAKKISGSLQPFPMSRDAFLDFYKRFDGLGHELASSVAQTGTTNFLEFARKLMASSALDGELPESYFMQAYAKDIDAPAHEDYSLRYWLQTYVNKDIPEKELKAFEAFEQKLLTTRKQHLEQIELEMEGKSEEQLGAMIKAQLGKTDRSMTQGMLNDLALEVGNKEQLKTIYKTLRLERLTKDWLIDFQTNLIAKSYYDEEKIRLAIKKLI